MVKNHLKRIAAPKSWDIERKTTTFVTRPLPGAHSTKLGMPLSLAIRELVKVAKTGKEAKQILNTKDVFVDKKKRREERLPVGIMDILEFPQLDKQYRILLSTKGKLIATEADAKESSLKIAKIESKTKMKGGETQISLSGGRSILVQKDTYKVGDSLIITLPDQKIQEHLKFENGALVLLIGGKRAGTIAHVEEIGKDRIILKLPKNERFETLRRYAFVVGKEKPALNSIKTLTGK